MPGAARREAGSTEGSQQSGPWLARLQVDTQKYSSACLLRTPFKPESEKSAAFSEGIWASVQLSPREAPSFSFGTRRMERKFYDLEPEQVNGKYNQMLVS